jgi:hypothetical protein
MATNGESLPHTRQLSEALTRIEFARDSLYALTYKYLFHKRDKLTESLATSFIGEQLDSSVSVSIEDSISERIAI